MSTTRAGAVCPVVGLEYEHLDSGLAGVLEPLRKVPALRPMSLSSAAMWF